MAAGGIGISLRRAADVLDERQVPLAGLVAAFIFAAQMLNFPVASGTSGHLLGGVLAAVLVGPYVGALCVAVVLFGPGPLFADGGPDRPRAQRASTWRSSAPSAGIVVFRAAAHVSSRRGPARSSSPRASPPALSVVLASVAFTVEYAIGGTGGASVATVVAAMVGVHTLIGIGEGVITALTVSAVLASRPDLVWGARDLVARGRRTGSASVRRRPGEGAAALRRIPRRSASPLRLALAFLVSPAGQQLA